MNILTKEQINQLPLTRFSGEIVVIQTAQMLDEILDELSNENVLGLDTEKRPVFHKGGYNPISIIQLATLSKAFLIQVQKSGVTQKLKDILTNPKIKKVGVGLAQDIKELKEIIQSTPQGCIGLDQLARSRGLSKTGVKSLAGQLLGHRISKRAQTSNWAKEHLTIQQKVYAATDAWVCLKIYSKLLKLPEKS